MGQGLIAGQKKMFQSKLHSSTDQILWWFLWASKHKKANSFQYKLKGAGYIRGGRGLDRPINGGLITKSLWYLANKHTWSWRSLPFHFSAHCQQKTWHLPVNPMAWRWTLWLNVLNRCDNVIKIECHNILSLMLS